MMIPKGLSRQSRKTWQSITATHILSADGLLVLEGALLQWDTFRTTGDVPAYRNFLASIRHLGISATEDDAQV